MTPVYMEDNNENDRVTSSECEPIYFHIVFVVSPIIRHSHSNTVSKDYFAVALVTCIPDM